MSVSSRLDAFQQRHPGAGFPLAVVYKFADDQGSYLAALITYYGLLAFFPLLLLLSTVLGLVLQGDAALQQRVLHSTLSQFPVIGGDLGDPRRLGGGSTGIIVGLLGSLYGGLGVAQAVQHAMNTAWAVPRNSRPNPLRARAISLKLLAIVGLAVLATTVLSALGSSAEAFGATLGVGFKILLIALSVAANAAVFILAFRAATARPLSAREVAPGALAAAVVWQLLQWFGAVYVGQVVNHASATNGVFALVLGLIAFMFVAAVAVILCVEANVVRVKRLHPRSLLTPFTDDVDLTPGDRRAYAGMAEAQRAKGFEEIDVSFDGPRDGGD